MKIFRYFSLLVSVVIISSCATTNLPSTGIVNEEVERANTIILFVDSSQEEAYRNMAQHLMDKGFAFSNTDNILFSISTDETSFAQVSNYSISLNISIRDIEDQTAVFVSGNVHSNFLGSSRIANYSGKGTIYTASWREMKEIASDFNHTDIKYRRD